MTIEMPESLKLLEIGSMDVVISTWNKMNQIKGLFDDFSKGNFEAFRNSMLSPNSLWLETTDGTGLLYLLNILPGVSASAHIIFWDRVLRGKEDVCIAAIKFAMQSIPLVKVNVFIPNYALALKKFVSHCGFQKEGKIRRWSILEGRLFDVFIFGITFEEVINGTVLRSTVTEPAGEGLHGTGTEPLRQHADAELAGPPGPSDAGEPEPDAGVDS